MKNEWIFRMLSLGDKSKASIPIKDRYYSMKRSFLVVMLEIAMIPLIIVSGLSYFKYRALLHTETVNNVRWNAESTRHTIGAFIDRLTYAVSTISDSYDFLELAEQETLDKVFERLKAEHNGLVDLSIIGPDGIQRSYSGPFNLIGKDYTDSLWYKKALARKIFVSEVFLGFRNAPHFVIAVSKKLNGQQKYWALRASIDMDTLDQFLSEVRMENLIDTFLVNNNGKLQSSSRYYGNVTDQSVIIENLPHSDNISISKKRFNGKTILSVVGKIKDTPWLLVLEEYGHTHKRSWLIFKRELIIIFVASLVVITLITIPIASILASTICQAEESHEAILAEGEHANKLASIGRLAAGIAHEINNPLAIINEKTGLMKDLIGTSGDFKYKDKFLSEIESVGDAVERSRKITHRLIGFARRMDVKMELVSVNAVIEEVCGFLEKEASYQNIKIEKSLQPDLPSVLSDHGQMQQIFLNIMNNAIDAVPDGGIIGISSRRIENDFIQVTIGDNGPGMSPQVLRNIFEPFFTTKHSDEKPGTGLGLSITYGLVKKLSGEITVKSDVDVGTAFIITLPLMPSSKRAGIK